MVEPQPSKLVVRVRLPVTEKTTVYEIEPQGAGCALTLTVTVRDRNPFARFFTFFLSPPKKSIEIELAAIRGAAEF